MATKEENINSINKMFDGIVHQIKASKTLDVDQMIEHYIDDLERFPLPVCFDPYEEVKAFRRRERYIEEVCKRWASIFGKRHLSCS